MNLRPPTLLLAFALAASALMSSCAPLTPEGKAKLAYTEKLVSGLGDKILRIGLVTGQITPEEAAAAREIGSILISPAPVPATQEAKNPGKNPVEPLAFNRPRSAKVPAPAYCASATPPTGPPRT